MAKRRSGWGICVSLLVVGFFGFVFVLDLPSYMTTGVYVDVILTASSHVRTEPQSVIGHTRGKKIFWKVFHPEFVLLPACPQLGCRLPS